LIKKRDDVGVCLWMLDMGLRDSAYFIEYSFQGGLASGASNIRYRHDFLGRVH